MASEAGHQPPVWIAVLVVPVIVAISLSTFSWSAANLEPRDLPLGGPVAVLLAWIVLGVGAILAGTALQRRRTAVVPL
jgi:hypothetical protein